MATYRRAPEVREIADRLIRDVEEHKALDRIHIEYVWRDKASRSKRRIVLAKARKVGGLNRYLVHAAHGLVDYEANTAPLAVVEVAEDTWDRLDDPQRRALVDHELCHLYVEFDEDGQPELSIRGHDLEEFGCIVERHGLWASHVATFGSKVAEQLALAVEETVRYVEGLADDEGED